MKYTLYTTMLAIAISLFACDPSEEDSTVMTSSFKSDMLAQVNELRRSGCQCGDVFYPPVEPLSWNSLLEEASLRHSLDMDNMGKTEHIGSDGSDSAERVQDTGYKWRTVGENVAGGYDTVSSVIQGWKSSEPHCKNMMNAAFNELGAAFSGLYWTQTFAHPQ